MAKIGELNWDELLEKSNKEPEHKPTALWVNSPECGIAPKGDAKPRLAKGEIPRRPSNEEIAKAILPKKSSQPTDQEMFGHLVVTEEQAKKAEIEWETKLQKSLTMPSIGTPLDEEEWGNCKSFNSTLSPEELAQRNMYTGE